MTERSHHSFLLALKSRVLVVSKERRRKAKTFGLLALQKSYLFRCFFALRAARQPFRHQSSQHFLLSHLFIFLRVRFWKEKEIDFFSLFSSLFFRGRCLASFCLQSRKFPSLSLSLSHSLTLFRLVNTQIHEKKFKKKRWWSFRREFILFF